MGRVAFRHLPIIQVPLLHPYMCQQLPGLPKDTVLTPKTQPYPAECSPDCLLRGAVSIPHDQDEEASLGQALPTSLHCIAGEAQGGDHEVDVLHGVYLLHLHAKDQLQAL